MPAAARGSRVAWFLRHARLSYSFFVPPALLSQPLFTQLPSRRIHQQFIVPCKDNEDGG
jgi:hypothetical protein